MSLDIRIGLGDCLDLMDKIESDVVDLVLTDLPYGVTECKWDTVIPFKPLWEHFERVTKPNGTIVLFGTEPFSSSCRLSNIKRYRYDWKWGKSKATGWPLANKQPLRDYEDIMVFYSSDIIKDNTGFFTETREYLISERDKAVLAGFNMNKVLGNSMGRHYFTRKSQFRFPLKKDYDKLQQTGFFKKDYEECKNTYKEEKDKYYKSCNLTYNPQFSKGKPYLLDRRNDKTVEVYNNVNPITISDGKRYPKSILYFPHDYVGYHPTQKPVKLLEYLIKTYTNTGDTVLDCCMGSGSTGVASINTGRDFIGIEIDEDYFNISRDRIMESLRDCSIDGKIEVL